MKNLYYSIIIYLLCMDVAIKAAVVGVIMIPTHVNFRTKSLLLLALISSDSDFYQAPTLIIQVSCTHLIFLGQWSFYMN
jgi:hypothetical protein